MGRTSKFKGTNVTKMLFFIIDTDFFLIYLKRLIQKLVHRMSSWCSKYLVLSTRTMPNLCLLRRLRTMGLRKWSFVTGKGVIHKPWGQMFGHFWPPPPCLWTILFNKTYIVIWTFGKPPPPAMSTWFMNAPKADLIFVC